MESCNKPSGSLFSSAKTVRQTYVSEVKKHDTVIWCSYCIKINYLAVLQLLYSKDRYSGGKQEIAWSYFNDKVCLDVESKSKETWEENQKSKIRYSPTMHETAWFGNRLVRFYHLQAKYDSQKEINTLKVLTERKARAWHLSSDQYSTSTVTASSILNERICYNHAHAEFLSPAPTLHLSTVASVSWIHMNKQAPTISRQKLGQSTEAKCPSQEGLLILWKRFEFTDKELYLSFHWTQWSAFPWQLIRRDACCLQSFLHAHHQWDRRGMMRLRSSRHFLPPGQTKHAAASVN